MSDTLPPPGRGLRVGLTVVVAAACVGFFTGTRGEPVRHGYREAPETVASAGVPAAPKNADVETVRYAPRQAEQQVALSALAVPPRNVLAPVERDEDTYLAEISARAQNRAYDGAPPTIPHAIEQQGAPACLACHAQGMAVRGKVARPLSHPEYTSCTQCHVTQAAPLQTKVTLEHSVSQESQFAGLKASVHGGRVFAMSPPQLPHRSFMRERCSSCHGVWAKGLATTHPARQSCTQCHALNASSDQAPVSTFLELGP